VQVGFIPGAIFHFSIAPSPSRSWLRRPLRVNNVRRHGSFSLRACPRGAPCPPVPVCACVCISPSVSMAPPPSASPSNNVLPSRVLPLCARAPSHSVSAHPRPHRARTRARIRRKGPSARRPRTPVVLGYSHTLDKFSAAPSPSPAARALSVGMGIVVSKKRHRCLNAAYPCTPTAGGRACSPTTSTRKRGVAWVGTALTFVTHARVGR
jgi:hypothetical protein